MAAIVLVPDHTFTEVSLSMARRAQRLNTLPKNRQQTLPLAVVATDAPI